MEFRNAEMTDKQLVELAQKGDRSAFEVLIRRYQSKILSLCCRLIGNAGEARELAADVFAEAFQSLPKFRQEAKFSTWLYRIASNRSFSRLREIVRDRKRFVEPGPDSEDVGAYGNTPLQPSQISHPIHQLELEETRATIRLVLSKLSEDQARILLLHDLEELPYTEIAEILDCPAGTVMSRLSRAREAFRKKWNQISLK
jgi:RNA polymerase sigma-70 factor (ECF subfamily)